MAAKSTRWLALAAPSAVAALLAGVAVSLLWRDEPGAPQLQSGILLEQPRPLPAFSLVDQNGQPFDRARLAGRWSVVFAGFTHCPDVCPTTLALLRQVEANLEADLPRYNTVFLSVDPARDTPERLRQYVRYFSADFIGLTGDPAQIERVCKNLGIASIKVPGEADGEYSIDHSTSLVLLNPKGEVAGYLQAPHKVQQLTDDLRRLLEANA